MIFNLNLKAKKEFCIFESQDVTCEIFAKRDIARDIGYAQTE